MCIICVINIIFIIISPQSFVFPKHFPRALRCFHHWFRLPPKEYLSDFTVALRSFSNSSQVQIAKMFLLKIDVVPFRRHSLAAQESHDFDIEQTRLMKYLTTEVSGSPLDVDSILITLGRKRRHGRTHAFAIASFIASE